MEIESECKNLEAKLRNFVSPEIFINSDLYNNTDARQFVLLIQKIINSVSLDLHEILIREAVFTPLQSFKDEQFYTVFSNFILKYSKKISEQQYFTILPYEEWKKRNFCAMKMRLISVFTDILKYLLKINANEQLEDNQEAAAERMGLPKTQEKVTIQYANADMCELMQELGQSIEILNGKVDSLSSRLDGIEGIVKNIYIEMLK